MKNEKRNEEHHVVTCAGDQGQTYTEQSKRTAELEKTVLSLRRLVERLQQDNKRLQSRPCTETKVRAKDIILSKSNIGKSFVLYHFVVPVTVW